jgi:hypothetical protein
MAISRKQALRKILGLVDEVERHFAKLEAMPDSRDAPHFRQELTNWLNQMEAMVSHVGKKTGAQWQARIEEWRARLI